MADKQTDTKRSQYYSKWDKFADESAEQIEKEDKVEKEEGNKALGIDEKAPKSEAEKADADKHAALKEAKKSWDRKKAEEEDLVFTLDGCEGETRELDAELVGSKRVLRIKSCTNSTITLPESLRNMIKIFVEDCEECTLTVGCTTITSYLEMGHCTNCNVNVTAPMHTVQLDLCDGVIVTYCDGPGALQPGMKVYHAGVKGLAVRGAERSVQADFTAEGAVPENEPNPAECQFVCQLVGGELLSEPVVRLGSRHLTERELQAEMEAAGQKDPKVHALLVQMALVEENKALGNEAFKLKEYSQAAVHYTKAIVCAPAEVLQPAAEAADAGNQQVVSIIYANRAFCFQKLGQHEKALEDADECLKLNPRNVKGHFRRGLALHAAGRFREACPALGRALELEPKNKAVKEALTFAEMRAARGAQK